MPNTIILKTPMILLVNLLSPNILFGFLHSTFGIGDISGLILYISLMFIPEMMYILSDKFKTLLTFGVSDKNGVIKRDSINNMIVHYVSITLFRIFLLLNMFHMVFSIPICPILLSVFFLSPMFIEFSLLLKSALKNFR